MASLINAMTTVVGQAWRAVALMVTGPDLIEDGEVRWPAMPGAAIDLAAEPNRMMYTGAMPETSTCHLCCKVPGQVGRGLGVFNFALPGCRGPPGPPAVRAQYTAMDKGTALAHATTSGRAGDCHRRRRTEAMRLGLITRAGGQGLVQPNPIARGVLVRCNACCLTPEGNTRGYAAHLTPAEDAAHFIGASHLERVAERRIEAYERVHDLAHRSPHVRVAGDKW
jgi:hypothetical protein